VEAPHPPDKEKDHCKHAQAHESDDPAENGMVRKHPEPDQQPETQEKEPEASYGEVKKDSRPDE
jgi:hypothetical protein